MRLSSFKGAGLLIFAFCAGACMPAAWSQPPEIPKISQFAPAKDLLDQVDFYIGRVSESVADPANFEGANQSRIVKDGNTLAALALMLAFHDDDFAGKAGMPALLAAAVRLAAATDNYEQAKGASDELKNARAATAPSGLTPRWEKAAALSALMKQTPLIHAGLKRSVEGSRFVSQAARSAGQAAALAAIAQASMLDEEYVKVPADAAKWRACCVEMRDAAGAVNGAIHAADRQRVGDGMKRLLQSCETCHAAFRGP